MTHPLGLPRPVINLLRLMEPHKDCLKWNVIEGSHKITLSLNWGFKKGHKGMRETLWGKLQRTLKLNGPGDHYGGVPRHITDAIHASPKKSAPPSTTHHSRQNNNRPPLRRQNSLPSTRISQRPITRSHTLPMNATCTNRSQCSPASVIMPNSNHHYSTSNSFPVTSDQTPASSHAISRQQSVYSMYTPDSEHVGVLSKFSWNGVSTPETIGEPLSKSTPLQPQLSNDTDQLTASGTSSPCLSRVSHANMSSASQRSNSQTRIKIMYRTEEEIEKSLEDIMAKTRERTRQQLYAIRREWNRTITDWDHIAASESSAIVNISSDSVDDDIVEVKCTVAKCLESCDKILYRYSTEIT